MLKKMILLAAMLIMTGASALWAQTPDYLIQVFSVQNEEAAQAKVNSLMEAGVPSFSRGEQVPDKGMWHRIYIGPFASKAEAQSAAAQLKSSGLVNDFIVRQDSPVSTAVAAPAPLVTETPAMSTPPPVPGTPPSVYDENGVPVIGSAPAGNIPQVYIDDGPPQNLPQAAAPTYGERMPQDYPAGQAAPVGMVPQAASQNPGLPQIVEPGQGAPAAASGAAATYGTPPPAPIAVAPVPVLAAGSTVRQEPTVAQINQGQVIPAKPVGAMKIQGFSFVVDLSSSMRRMSTCNGRIKEEAVASLLRKMNQRIPSHPYTAALRVFGYKQSWTRKDYSTLYYGPEKYNRDEMGHAISRLVAADSISPFGSALEASENEIAIMGNPRAVLMFSDFEVSADPGDPVNKVRNARLRHGSETYVYTFYVSRQKGAEKLARAIAEAGSGKAYDICQVLDDENAFEEMMTEIFGPRDVPPCADSDRDGVCDEDDRCPNTPLSAPVDERGCWIAAYAQFFDFDKADVKSEFKVRIKNAAEILKNNPQIKKVVIAGHTDSKGSVEYNLDLGRRRAESVKQLLIEYGAPAEILFTESYGKSKPIADNATVEGQAKNRRVEFHIGDMPPDSAGNL